VSRTAERKKTESRFGRVARCQICHPRGGAEGWPRSRRRVRCGSGASLRRARARETRTHQVLHQVGDAHGRHGAHGQSSHDGIFVSAIFLQRVHGEQRQVRLGLRVVREVVVQHLLRGHVLGVRVHDDVAEQGGHVDADGQVLDDPLEQRPPGVLLVLRGVRLRRVRPQRRGHLRELVPAARLRHRDLPDRGSPRTPRGSVWQPAGRISVHPSRSRHSSRADRAGREEDDSVRFSTTDARRVKKESVYLRRAFKRLNDFLFTTGTPACRSGFRPAPS
jgi:hypothetical protein